MADLASGTRIHGTGTVDTQLVVNGNIASTSTNTGALQVVGGVGIGGNLNVSGTLTVNGVSVSGVASGSVSQGVVMASVAGYNLQ